jgi:hypothetical protein
VITVTIMFPDGRQRDVLLRGDAPPRVGELIELKDTDANDPIYVVDQVMWKQLTTNGQMHETGVSVAVRPYLQKGMRG